MKTDIEKFDELMTDLGVTASDKIKYGLEEGYAVRRVSVPWKDSDNPKVEGYSGFRVAYLFDKDTGKFIKMGIWE